MRRIYKEETWHKMKGTHCHTVRSSYTPNPPQKNKKKVAHVHAHTKREEEREREGDFERR